MQWPWFEHLNASNTSLHSMSFDWHWMNYSYYTTEINTRRVRHLLCWCHWFSFIFKRWTQLCIWKIFGIFAPLERGWNNCICNNRNEDIKDLHKIFQVIVHREGLNSKTFPFFAELISWFPSLQFYHSCLFSCWTSESFGTSNMSRYTHYSTLP